MIPMSHLSFVQCEQLKFRPKKIDKMKVYHGVVAVGIVGVGVGGARDGWGNSCHVTHVCNIFNLLSFTIPNKA